MLQMKLSVNHMRVLVIGVNLVLTTIVGGHAIYRARNSGYAEEDLILKKMMNLAPDKFSHKTKGATANANEIRRVVGLQQAFDPPKFVPPPIPGPDEGGGEGGGESGQIGSTGITIEEGGPLEENWTYASWLYFGPGSELNRIVLQRKQATRVTRSIVSRTAGRTRTIRSTRTRTSRTVPRRTTQSTGEQKVLHLYEGWTVDENEGLKIWIVDVARDRFVYQDDSDGRLYYLPYESEDIYEDGDDGQTLVKKAEDEEEGEEEKEEEPPNRARISWEGLTSYRELYESRELGGGPSGASAAPSRRPTPGSAPAAAPMSPQERARQLRSLGTAVRDAREKMSASDRQKWDEAVKKLGNSGK